MAPFCCCLLPSCGICLPPEVLPHKPCCCLLPTCPKCAPAAAVPEAAAAEHSERPTKRRRKVPEECHCFQPGCPFCIAVPVRGRVKCPLSKELELDPRMSSEEQEEEYRKHAQRMQQIPRNHPRLSALNYLGLRGQTWLFWEVFAGVGNLTKAVVERLVFLGVSPEKVGPPVDVKRSRDGAPQLCLDLLDPSCQSFIWCLLQEVAPEYLHFGPPCTFFVLMSRLCLRSDASEFFCRPASRKRLRKLLLPDFEV